MITGNENKAIQEVRDILSRSKYVEVKPFKKTRSNTQNRALHLFFTFVSNELNELGHTYKYFGLKGQVFELPFTPDLVKSFVWRPIQLALFDIKSTTKINTQQINEILDVLILWFAEQGVVVSFPSRFENYLDIIEKQQK